MKSIYISMMSLFLIAQCNLHNHQVDDSLDRMKRDAPPIKSKAAVVVDQHMKLARILNAIYLQMQLTNNKIDDFDVIAGIWEVDRSSIEKLVSLKVDALDGSLNSSEQMVNDFPNDLQRIADVEEISKKMDSVKEITPEKREALMLAMSNDSVPGFLVKNTNLKWNFTVNLADIALQELKKVKDITVDNFKRSDIDDLITSMRNVVGVLFDVNEWSKAINETQQKMTSRLVEGYQSAIEVQNKLNDLKELPKLLIDLGNVLPNLQQLKNIKGVSSMQEQSRYLLNALLQLHQISNKSIAPAFASNFDITTVKESLKDKRIMMLLSGGKELSSLESYLDDILSIAKTFTPVNQNMETLMCYDLIDQLDLMSQSLDEISKFQSYSNPLNFTSLSLCSESLSLEKEVGQSELKTVAQDLNLLLSVIPTILDKLKNVEAIREDVNNFRFELDKIEKKDAFEKWLNENGTDKVQKALEASRNVFEGIMQTQDVADAIGRLPSQKNLIFSIQKRIANFSILKKECESLFDFDIEPFKAFNEVPGTIQRMKEENAIQMVKPLVGTIPKLREDLEKLKRKKSPATTVAPVTTAQASTPKGTGTQKSKRSADDGKKFESQNSQDLLDAAISVRGLEIMDMIFQYSNLIDTVIQEGTLAENSTHTMKNPLNKAELEKIWKDFGLMKTKLEAVKSNNKRLVDTVTSSGKEKSLEEMNKKKEKRFRQVFRSGNGAGMIGGIGGVVVLVIAAIVTFCFYCKYIHDPEMREDPPVDTTPFMPNREAMENQLDYMQFQDSRFEINQRNTSGYTKLYVAFLNENFEEMRRLANKGAIIDAVCGQYNRPVLLEAAVHEDSSHCDFLLEAHASLDIWDCDSNDIEALAPEAGCVPHLSRLKQERTESYVRNRLFLPEPRPWKILVLKKGTFPLWKRKKLPHRIKACTKWGWTGEDLNQYTTIILPWKYIKGKNDKDNNVLMMDDSENLLKWKLVGCSACLLTVQFFERLYDAYGWPDDVHEVLQTDYRNWVMSMEYKGQLHERTIYKHKNGIHQMQPPLLQDVEIVLLPTNSKKKMDKQKSWKEIIKIFGGTIVEKLNYVDGFHTYPPYHAASPIYKSDGLHQNRIWILKEPDSELEQEWIDEWDKYTCVDFEFLPECIARFYLLPTNNDVVPLAYQKEGKGGKGYLKAQQVEAERQKIKKQKATASSVASTSKQGNTTSNGSTLTTLSTVEDGKAGATKKPDFQKMGKKGKDGKKPGAEKTK